jgi:propionate CoA-transferase
VRDKKIDDLGELMRTIPNGATLVIGGAGGVQEPDALIDALVRSYEEDSLPSGLVEVHPFRTGESVGHGLSRLDAPGLIAKMIGSSYWPIGVPPLIQRILDDEVEAYNVPIGPLYGMLQAGASNSPGYVTDIGLGTFVDPRQTGGSLNKVSVDSPVRLVEIDGDEHLFYDAIRPDVAFLRATVSDGKGNLSTSDDPTVIGLLLLAQATKANGGIVIAQVRELVPDGSLDPRLVKVPAHLVDHVVVSPGQLQTPAGQFDPTLVGLEQVPLASVPRVPLSASKVVQRRALREAVPGTVVAIGFGLPGNIPNVAVEEGVFDSMTFTIEHGAVGGINPYAFGSRTFPAAHNPSAIIDAVDMVRGYAGGTVDMAYLGVGEIDSAGNVNVSRFGDRIPGCGGFVDITQGIRKIVFCAMVGDKGHRKFVPEVQQVTMSAEVSLRLGHEIVYVTEVAVFRLTERGLTLEELAPGLSIDELRSRLGADFAVAERVTAMPEECWAETTMNLAAMWSGA